MPWHYAQRGRPCGPVDEAELRRLAEQGRIVPDTLVWTPSFGDAWRPASSVETLFPPASGRAARGSGATSNRDLMRRARESLRSRWRFAVGATLLFVAILAGAGPLLDGFGARLGVPPLHALLADGLGRALDALGAHLDAGARRDLAGALDQFSWGGLLGALIAGPMAVGLCSVFLAVARGAPAEVGRLFDGWGRFLAALGAHVLMTLFVFLWSLLLIVPGLVAWYAYAMTFFVLADDPAAGPRQAIARSKEMMRGRKWDLFCLHWRFVGWALLGVLTCGVGFLWMMPYLYTTLAHFYEDARSAEAA